VWKVNNIDGEEGRYEAHWEEYNSDKGEDHNCLALSGRILCLVALESSFERIGVLLFQVEYLREVSVDTLSLLIHPRQVHHGEINRVLLLAYLVDQLSSFCVVRDAACVL